MLMQTSPRSHQFIGAALVSFLIYFIWVFIPHPAVGAAAGLIPIVLMVVLRLPFLMVLLFVIFSFFRIHEVIPQLYSLKIPLLLSLASITGLFWHIAISKKIKPYWNKELTIFALFFSLVFIDVIFASNRPIAIAYFKGIYWKIGLMTVAIAWLTRKPKDFTVANLLIVCSGALVGLVAIMNKAQGIGLVEETRVTIGRNIGSVLGDPNDLSLVLMFPAAFAVSLMVTKNIGKLPTLIGLISTPILFSAVIATQSRGGLLGIMAVFGIVAWRKIRSKSLIFFLGAIAAVILYSVAGISDRASGGAAEEGLDASAKGRLYAWEGAFLMAIDNPLTGVGLDNFYSNYFYYSPHWDGLNHAVHSTWFGVLAETGFLGLAVFISMIVILMKSSQRSLKLIETKKNSVHPFIQASALATFTGLIGTVVSGTFLTQGFTWPIYISAAFIIAISQWVKENLLNH